jgi:hypothetical protein
MGRADERAWGARLWFWRLGPPAPSATRGTCWPIRVPIFVVRNLVSRARVVREALELLYQRQARVLGVIFNAANTSAKSYYYYKYADYHQTETKDQGPRTRDRGPETKD